MSCIRFGSARYSVPTRHIGRQVEVRVVDGVVQVVLLGAVDPPRAVGGWIPDQVRLAGGWELLGQAGWPAEETSWDAVRDTDPEVLVLLPNGLPLPEATRAWESTPRPECWPDLRAAMA